MNCFQICFNIAFNFNLRRYNLAVTAAALGLVRFWCADDFNRRALVQAGAGGAAARLLAHPDSAVRRAAARTAAALAAFPALQGVTRRLAASVGALASSVCTLNAPEGLLALLELAIVNVAHDASSCCVEAMLPLHHHSVDAAAAAFPEWTSRERPR